MEIKDLIYMLVMAGYTVSKESGTRYFRAFKGSKKIQLIPQWNSIDEWHVGETDSFKPNGKWLVFPVQAPVYIKNNFQNSDLKGWEIRQLFNSLNPNL